MSEHEHHFATTGQLEDEVACAECGLDRTVWLEQRIEALEAQNAHLLDRNVAAMHIVYLAAGLEIISERGGTSLISSQAVNDLLAQARALLKAQDA